MAVLLGRYKSSTSAIATQADTSVDVVSAVIDFEGETTSIGPGDHVYLTLGTLDTGIEVIKATGIVGNSFSPVERGQSGTTAKRWPVGTIIELTDDPLTLTEFVEQKATQADPSDQAAIQNEVTQQVNARVKPSARVGGGRYPLSDIGGANDLDSENHDSVDQGRDIPLIDGNGNVVERISIHETREFVKEDIDERLVPEGGTTDQVLAKRSGTNFDLKWKDDESGTGDSNVDSDQLVPAGGSTGQVLTKKTGTDYDDEWADAPGLTGTEVNTRIAARVPDGGSTGQVLKKASSTNGDTEWGEDRTNPATIPSGTSFPANPTGGDRFRLTHGTSQIDDHVIDVVQAQTTLRQLHLGGGSNLPNYLRSYSTTYAGQSQATLRGKTFIVYSGSGSSNPPARLHFYDPGAARVTYAVSGTPAGPGILASYYEVTGLTYALFSVGAHETNIQYADGTRFFADAPIDIGDYTYTGTRWDFTPGVAASWAVQGEAEPQETPEDRQLPAGGATGQVLKKDSATDYDVSWQPAGAGTDDQTASEVNTDTSNFDKNLSSTDTTVQKALETLDDYSYELPANLALLNRNVLRGGWRADTAIQVSRVKAALFTLNDARTETYTPRFPNDGSDLGPRQTNVNIAVRVAKTLFDSIPNATERTRIRVRLDSSGDVSPLLSTATYLGEDVDGDYDYFRLPIPDLPADSIARPEFDAPAEIENITIPASAVEGLRERGGAGLKLLLDGNINSPGGTPLNSNHNGNATYFSPTFDLDDHPSGIFEVILRVTVATTSQTLSLTRGETNTTATVDGTVSASDLASKAAFSRADPIEGVLAAVLPVYTVSASTYTEIGRLNLYLVHDANNEAQYLLDYRDNTEHTISGNASWSSHLVVAFQESDSGTGGSGGTVTATATLPDILELDVAANSKTFSGTNVQHSDWSTVALANKATATEGVTVASNRITFSQAKKVSFHAKFRTSGTGSGGGSRIYNYFRVSEVGTPNTVVRNSEDSGYNKATAPGQALQQGPPYQITTLNFNLDVDAGKSYIVEWQCYAQDNTTVTMDHATSEVDITFREPTITIT